MGDEMVNDTQQQVHISADDLNDGFILDSEDKKTLAYKVRPEKSQTQITFTCLKWTFFVYPGWKMEH